MSTLGMLRAGAAAQQGARRHRALSLPARIIAEYAAVMWTVFFIGLSRSSDDFSLVGTAVETWVDHSGFDNHATQATSASRPTYSATAVNGLPGITLDGGDFMVTGNADPAGATAYVAHALFTVANGIMIPVEWGNVASGTGVRIVTPSNTQLRTDVRGNVGTSQALSDTSLTLGTPAVNTATWDTTLATNESEIRRGGSIITSTRPTNANNATGMASAQPITIGAASGGVANRMIGSYAALVIAAGPGPITGAVATAISNVDQLLAANKGL